MTDWQPIETAPRDGTEIIVYSPREVSLSIAMWHGREWKCTAAGSFAIEYVDDFRTEFVAIDGPTHWMPMPEPPKKERDDA